MRLQLECMRLQPECMRLQAEHQRRATLGRQLELGRRRRAHRRPRFGVPPFEVREYLPRGDVGAAAAARDLIPRLPKSLVALGEA